MRFTVIAVWLFLFGATGFSLFTIAFQVEEMEQELTKINSQIIREQETIHVLDAEWAYLNRPDRLQQLSKDLLPYLSEASVDQISTLGDIPHPLPQTEPGELGDADALATNTDSTAEARATVTIAMPRPVAKPRPITKPQTVATPRTAEARAIQPRTGRKSNSAPEAALLEAQANDDASLQAVVRRALSRNASQKGESE